MPFDWYTINFEDFLPWLGSVMQNIYFIWEALFTEIQYLPTVGTVAWPDWLQQYWTNELFGDKAVLSFVGDINLIEFALGSYLVVVVVVAVIKSFVKLFSE